MTQQIVPTSLPPVVGREQKTVASATSLIVPDGAKFAYLQAQSGNIRWTDDGTTVTGSVGMLLIAGQAPFPYAGNLKALSFMDDGSDVSTLIVHYYGYIGAA